MESLVGIVALILVILLAVRLGAFLMKGFLGLLVIGLVLWLLASLFGGGAAATGVPVAIG